MSFNLAVMLYESALAHPERPAVLFNGTAMTYAQLEDAANRVADGLHAAGVRRGDTVALQLPNVPQFVIAHFAALKTGAAVVPMNVLLKGPEVAFHLANTGAKVLITWRAVAAEALKGVAEAGLDTATYVVGGEAEGTRPFEELLAGDPATVLEPTSADDTAVILHTSGTTGKPKGAELTHFQLFMNSDPVGRRFGIRADDVILTVLPLFHVFALSSIMHVAVRFGAAMSLVPRFEATMVLETVQRDRCTVYEGVPTMFYALLAHSEAALYDTSSLRIAISGGASIPGEMLRAFEARFGLTILEGYGLSETASTATFNWGVDERKTLSVGRRPWGVRIAIVDDQGNHLPPGPDHVGEIVIQGHNVMKGYYNDPEATAAAFVGGWFHTGDMGYLDDDDFLFIVDRKKELVIRGGYNVYPREVEEVLYAHPAVAQAAVLGMPHERLGEDVLAVVALKPGAEAADEEALIAFCRERLASYKYPRRIRFVEALPLGPTGKVLKKELRAQLGLPTAATGTATAAAREGER
jgi:long-chain acyl-CoA synthetase